MKRALITGLTGQDGSYLAELLLETLLQVESAEAHQERHQTGTEARRRRRRHRRQPVSRHSNSIQSLEETNQSHLHIWFLHTCPSLFASLNRLSSNELTNELMSN